MYTSEHVEDSAGRAGSILEAWVNGDISRLGRELNRSSRLLSAAASTSVENERCELLGCIAGHLTRFLGASDTQRASEMKLIPTDLRLLEHLVMAARQ